MHKLWMARRAGVVSLFGILLLLPALSRAQQSNSVYNTRKTVTLSTVRFAEARAATNRYLQRRAVRVQRKDESVERLVAEFVLPVARLGELDSLVTTLGYVTENNLTAQDVAQQVQQLKDDAEAEEAQLGRLQQQRAAAGLDAAQREALDSRISSSETRLRQLRQQQRGYAGSEQQAFVTLNLFDEVSFPTGNSKINFVNMPGVEVAYLRLDNPRPGLTSPAYRGYALKYLFTRGKSYFNLGVYKPTQTNKTDSAFVSELFVLNFGQDFYPRHFGRGRRKFLNLYTTYQIGGFILNRNQDNRSQFVPNANVGLGLELIKTRHILLDNKVTYFLPLHELNRQLRGVLYQASFSFVF